MTFTLTVLGSSSALPTSERFTSAHVLNVHEHLFLIDCGEGTQIQLRKFKIKFSKIDHIFISHNHGDHILGMVGLISSFDLLGRKHPLNIYSPGDIESIIKSQLFFFDNKLNFEIIYHKVDNNNSSVLFKNKHVKVISFPLKHKIPAVGYLFTEIPPLPNIDKEKIKEYNIPVKAIHSIKCGSDYITDEGVTISNSELISGSYKPKSYAYCSDTIYSEEIIPYLKKVSLLYHETTFMMSHADRAKETMHSTTLDAANIAKKSEAGKLLIGHFSVRYKDVNAIIEETSTVFDQVIAAEDGLVIEI